MFRFDRDLAIPFKSTPEPSEPWVEAGCHIWTSFVVSATRGPVLQDYRSNIIVDICTEGSRRATVAVCAMKALGPIQEGFATFWGPVQVLENELYVTQYITFAEPKCPIHHKIMF